MSLSVACCSKMKHKKSYQHFEAARYVLYILYEEIYCMHNIEVDLVLYNGAMYIHITGH